MNEKEKKVISILVIIFIIIMIGTIVFTVIKNKNEDTNLSQEETEKVQEFDDGTKLNINSEFNKTRKFKNLELSDIQFTSKNGNSQLLIKVINKAETIHEPEIVEISVISNDGKVLEDFEPIIGKINPGETIELNLISTTDLVNAKDFTINAK